MLSGSWLWSDQDQDHDLDKDQDQDQNQRTRTRVKKPLFFVFFLRFCPDVGHQLHLLQTPVFSGALNQLANELRDRCLRLILPACISGESGYKRGAELGLGSVGGRRGVISTILVCPEVVPKSFALLPDRDQFWAPWWSCDTSVNMTNPLPIPPPLAGAHLANKRLLYFCRAGVKLCKHSARPRSDTRRENKT